MRMFYLKSKDEDYREHAILPNFFDRNEKEVEVGKE
jgi:hypothetical protein